MAVVRAATGWLATARVRQQPAGLGAAKRSIVWQVARWIATATRGEGRRRSADPAAGVHALSRREREIVGHLAAACTYKETAKELGLGYGAVHTSIKVLFKRFGVHSKVALVGLLREAAGAPVAARPREMAARTVRSRSRIRL